MTTQLLLRLSPRETATFANFYPGHNLPIINALKALVAGEGEHFIYLWGQSGVGRSHLLHACCHQLQQENFSVMYLSLKDPQLTPAVLQDMEKRHLVCVDDIDAVLGQYAWEEALLHFYNRVRDLKGRLVMVGNALPSHLQGPLSDLHSRLAWGLVFHVVGLSDDQKIKALQIHAHDRGIALSDEVGRFLLHHYPRDMGALFNLLNKLDQASLAEKRKLTVPFVKQVLNQESMQHHRLPVFS